jgi:hypothetical protein
MKIGFLEEGEGQKSATRLIFVIGSLWNMALSTYLAYKGGHAVDVLSVWGGVQAILTGGKLIQKPMEQPEPPKA